MITMPAILNVGRLNAFRLNYLPTPLRRVREGRVTIWLGGVLATSRVRKQRLSIRDILNDAPNTCALVVEGTAPTPGQDLRVSVNSNDPHLLFNGTLQTVDALYEGRPTQLAWSCAAVDDTARANRYRPFGNWVDTSATAIAQQLTASFAPGFTTVHVQAGLPLASITFDGTETFAAALKRLANLIGGYCYFEDLDVHLFISEASELPDAIDTTPRRFLDSPPITRTVDDSQLHTRVYGKGHGEAALADMAPGATILPIASTVMFNALGGKAIAGSTPDGAQYQRLTYTGVQAGGVGSLVGPGVAPSAAPTLAPVAGGVVEPGVHQYAYTWVTASGETRPGPLAAVTVGPMAPPIQNPVVNAPAPALGNMVNGAQYLYKFSWSTDSKTGAITHETLCGPRSDPASPYRPNNGSLYVQVLDTIPAGAVSWIVYRTAANGSVYKRLAVNGDINPAQWGTSLNVLFTDLAADATLGVNEPVANTTVLSQVVVSAVAIGPTGTTARKVYRTVAGGAQLKLQQTIANNTATTGATDNTPDASLGANAPAADTSGLSTTAGQVNAGSTSLLTASAAPFVATGGYVLLPGPQVVQYTGITGNTLTGIPASGPGSIVTTVPYGAPVTAAPALTGVSGITQPVLKGAQVCIWVRRDDTAAQAARQAVDATNGRTTDGVVEQVLTDERRGEPSLTAQCDADLKLFGYPIVTVTYDSRDLKTKSGKPITFNLPSPAIAGTLTIQDVTITEIDIATGVLPRFHVMASSTRFSLEDILRQLLTETNAV